MYKIESLGYDDHVDEFRKKNKLENFELGRISSEHKDRYTVKTVNGDFFGELVGNLRYTAQSKAELPVVGDWVAVSEFDTDKVIIHKVSPRKTLIERKAPGKYGEKQLIAANIDVALIMQSVNNDHNINRLERYLSICYISRVEPVILLNKIDLSEENELQDYISKLRRRLPNIKIIAFSNITKIGLEDVKNLIQSGKTYCLLGSSGVGKSSLVNNLLGGTVMDTGEISSSSGKGKHITSYREMLILTNGGIIIDNPGMREIGITESSEGLNSTFDKILQLAEQCKYGDCTHTSEYNCAVIDAVEKGEIEKLSYLNYLNLEKEKEHFESTILEKRKKDKDFGKMVKRFKKIKNQKR